MPTEISVSQFLPKTGLLVDFVEGRITFESDLKSVSKKTN